MSFAIDTLNAVLAVVFVLAAYGSLWSGLVRANRWLYARGIRKLEQSGLGENHDLRARLYTQKDNRDAWMTGLLAALAAGALSALFWHVSPWLAIPIVIGFLICWFVMGLSTPLEDGFDF